MLINQKVSIKPSNNNKKRFIELGYSFKNGQAIEVDIHDLSKGSHAIVKTKCDNCGNVHDREAREVFKHKNHYCSKDCEAEDKSKKEFERFNKLVGENGEEFLYKKYVIEKMSARSIAKEVYNKETGASTIVRWIKALGLENEIRHGSEAIKTQWINNPKRKKEQGELIKKHLGAGTPSRMKLIKKMNTIEYKEKSRVAKLGKNNPMYGVTGENHPHWNPSLTNEERLLKRKVPQNYKWIRDVYKRDNYTCQCCGYDKGGTLVAHHLNSWHWDKDNRFNIENGVTLCESCHHRFHKEYGYKDNTKEQFLEYLNKALVK